MLHYHVHARSAASAATIYALLLDASTWKHWMAIDKIEIQRLAARDDHVGEVRLVTTGSHVSREQIVAVERGRGFTYLNESKYFSTYRGKARLIPLADGSTQIDWHAEFSTIPIFVGWFMWLFLTIYMGSAVRKLARFAETGQSRLKKR